MDQIKFGSQNLELVVNLKNLVIVACLIWWQIINPISNLHYYCTAADERHYPLLLNLIGSIHQNDWTHCSEIAVFDLGFNAKQREDLQKMAKVSLHTVDLIHPDLLKPFKTSPTNRLVRGWFAWKPVVIKQALDLFPYVLYADAGTTILKSPDIIFKHIQQQGYFLISTGSHAIEERITKAALHKIVEPLASATKAFLLDPHTNMISPGLQGLARAVYDSYVLPMYQTATDLSLFVDDGTSRLGFGAGRHDQPIFSIYAYLNRMYIHPEGWMNILVDGDYVPQHIHWDIKQVCDQTVIFQSRWLYRYRGGFANYIRLSVY